VNNCNLWYKPWFYTYIRSKLIVLSKSNTSDDSQYDFIPTYQYIFRHNRAVFWALRDQLPERYGNHWLFRLALGWLTPPKVTFLKLPATAAIREEMMLKRVYQDIVLPISTLEEAIDKASDLFHVWPILVYPSRIYDHDYNLDEHNDSIQGQFRRPAPKDIIIETVREDDNKSETKAFAMYYDLGVYGIPRAVRKPDEPEYSSFAKQYKQVSAMRKMEHFTRDVRGAPFLYADTFMTKAEFGEMFDLRVYERARTKYGAVDHFPHLFDKTSGCQSYDWNEVLKKEKVE